MITVVKLYSSSSCLVVIRLEIAGSVQIVSWSWGFMCMCICIWDVFFMLVAGNPCKLLGLRSQHEWPPCRPRWWARWYKITNTHYITMQRISSVIVDIYIPMTCYSLDIDHQIITFYPLCKVPVSFGQHAVPNLQNPAVELYCTKLQGGKHSGTDWIKKQKQNKKQKTVQLYLCIVLKSTSLCSQRIWHLEKILQFQFNVIKTPCSSGDLFIYLFIDMFICLFINLVTA